jgi:tRNA(Ile)-lysidine synthase
MLSDIFSQKLAEIFADKLPKKIAVAVSGGCDSVALTILLDEFCRGKKIKLFAVTIDHKMRESSSREALELGKILAKKKISHEVLSIFKKEVPQKNIEASLRELRYDMLRGFCEENKIEHLFLGHHAGDVAENFLIRLFRGSGLDGLSTMAEVGEYKGIKLTRPLLDFEKDDLKSFLTEKKIKWFEDETNDDEKFLRNKIRKFFESFEEKNLIQKRIKKATDEISQMRDFLDEVLLREAYSAVRFEGNYFLLNHEKFKQIPRKIGLKILALILMEVGGKEYKPRLEKLQRFYEWIVETENHKKKNFYGCMVAKFDAEFLKVYAERDGEKLGKIKLSTILKKVF